jgi:hypothetical protein
LSQDRAGQRSMFIVGIVRLMFFQHIGPNQCFVGGGVHIRDPVIGIIGISMMILAWLARLIMHLVTEGARYKPVVQQSFRLHFVTLGLRQKCSSGFRMKKLNLLQNEHHGSTFHRQ